MQQPQGSLIINTLLSLPSITSVHALARREPSPTAAAFPKMYPLVSPDTSEWPSKLSSIAPPPSILFSGLGTTRAAAGGVDNQRKIDYDLNLALAQAARIAGVKVYVLVSSNGANAASGMAYPRMKGELEESVKGLGFDVTVILRPGLIVGDRQESRPAEAVVRGIAGLVGVLGNALKDPWAQDANVIARAAVASGLQALEGKAPGKVWVVGQSDIVRMGRTEWKA